MYIWQRNNWPDFTWDQHHLAVTLAEVHREQGILLGKMETLGFDLRDAAHLDNLTREVVKSSEIEGEVLDSDRVRSSIAHRLGMDIAGLVSSDRRIDGVVEMMLDATQRYAEPLTTKRLSKWHAALFPTAYSGMQIILPGHWRTDSDDPMQVVSGPFGRERIHYEAPPANELTDEIEKFLEWFNKGPVIDPLLKAGIAHLWFVTAHPFEDGNGRIARAITDLALARSERSPQRSYSMSARIRKERKDYYTILEQAQKSSMDATPWLEWFLACLHRALTDAQSRLGTAIKKARFWDRYGKEALNNRQISVLQRFMQDDWKGKLTTSKWARIAKCSQDTAGRDINDLIRRGARVKNPEGGRSTSYSINLDGTVRAEMTRNCS